jgi:receptor protein-tyrosine kinase
LRARFDYVVIDSSPLLAVTDGAILAADADGALLVVRSGKTKRDQVEYSAGILRDVGAPVLGAVLTMMPTRGSGANSYNYYYYGGSYGDQRPPDNTPPPQTRAGGLTGTTASKVAQDLEAPSREATLPREAPETQSTQSE